MGDVDADGVLKEEQQILETETYVVLESEFSHH